MNLSEATTRGFLTLTEKASLVKHIYIDPETLDISMQKEDGSELKREPTLRRRAADVCHFHSLGTCTYFGLQGPVVIDTPWPV